MSHDLPSAVIPVWVIVGVLVVVAGIGAGLAPGAALEPTVTDASLDGETLTVEVAGSGVFDAHAVWIDAEGESVAAHGLVQTVDGGATITVQLAPPEGAVALRLVHPGGSQRWSL